MSSFSIKPNQERANVQQLDQLENALARVIRDLEYVQNNLNGESLSAVSHSLGVVIQESRTRRQSIINVKQSLDEIITLYEQTERRITGTKPDIRVLQKLNKTIRQRIDEIKRYLADYLKSLKGKDSEGCTYGGDPINFSTGNFVLVKEYLKLQGHFPLSFALSYNSLETGKGQVGTGWNHNFQMYVEKSSDKYVLHCEDGREETFLCTEQEGLRPLLDSGRRMEEHDDQILVTDAHGIICVFDFDGRISEMRGRHAGALSFFYDEQGKLQNVRSTSGEELCFTYGVCDEGEWKESNCSGLAVKLIRVNDNTGRSVELAYQGDFLTEIIDELGNPISFSYNGNGFLTSVKNAVGVVSLRNEYDTTGRVIRQHFPDGGAMQLDYEEECNTLHVTEQNGNRISYVQDELYRNVETIYENGKIRTTYDHRNRKTSYTDKKGNTTYYAYDLTGRLSGITNPLGEEMLFTYNKGGQVEKVRLNGRILWTNAYDENGNLTERTDALGRTSSLCYNEYGKPVKIIQPDESEILLDYDDSGNIIRVHAPFGGTACYEYDKRGNVTASIDGNGNRTEYSYNDRDFLCRVKNAEGNTREYTYNFAGMVTGIRDFDGSVLRREYNDVNKLTRVTDQDGNVTKYAYDNMFNVISRKEANGAEFIFEYDKLHRLTGITNPLGGHINYEYDENDNQTRLIDETGKEIRCEYDSLDRLVSVTDADGSVSRTQYNSMGQPIRITDACGNVRREEYDAAGQRIRTIDVAGNETTYAYDRMGNLTEFTDAAGRTTAFEYLPGGLLRKVINPDGTFSVFEYDQNRNVISRADQNGYFVTYEYDCMNRVTTVSDPDGLKKRFKYDALGNVSEVTDANGGITHYTYTPAGKLSGVTDPLGNRTWYSYDNMGFMTDVWQEDGQNKDHVSCPKPEDVQKVNAAGERRHLAHYERNCMGQLTRACDALGNTERYSYDRDGRLTQRKDPEGNRFDYTYTAGGLLSGILCADGRSVEMSYNPLKQLTQIRDWLGTTTIENDAAGRPVRITDPNGNEVTYRRGVLGEREALIYPGGKTVTYQYDELRRLISMDSDEGRYGFAYDENGRLCKKSLPNGILTKYAYDLSGRLSILESRDREGLLDRFAYAYDPMGNTALINRERRELAEESGRYRYIYDACSRLIEVRKDGEVVEAYGYDGFGNRSYALSGGRRTDYAYDRANQMIRSVTENIVTDYRYDSRGNLLEQSENQERRKLFCYDAFNNMSACIGEEKSASYEYNGLGHRVAARYYGKDTKRTIEQKEYLYDLTGTFGNLLEERSGDHATVYVWNGNLAASVTDGTVRYFLHDAVGSPIRAADERGSVQESFSWDSFGNRTMKNAGPEPTFGFTGFFTDSVAGMYVTNQRGYMPVAGRFAARDIMSGLVGSPQTLNDYTYCWNRPLDLVDYDGAFPTWNDVQNVLRHTADTVTDGVKDAWDTGVGYVRNGTKTIFNTAKYLYEKNVPKEAQAVISAGGTILLNGGRGLIEADPFGWGSISDGFAWLTDSPAGTWFLDKVSFTRTSDGVYHAKQNCWQEPFGYNDFYDYVFDGATSCRNRKFNFYSDGTQYTIWMWKGDYLNLGAGCETGIYYSEPGSYHMYSATDTGITQTISLRNKQTGEIIFEYAPGTPTWWVTGFHPKYQDYDRDDLEVSGSICFINNPKLWEDFYKTYKGRRGWCFDEGTKTVFYKW